MLKILIGIVIGGALGSAMGYYGKCSSGACPLTATPIRGGLYGAFMGMLFATMLSTGGEKVDPAVRQSGARAVVHVTSQEVYDRLLAESKPVLVDVYSDRCGPCRVLAPTIDKLAHEYEGRAVVAKINADKSPDLAHQLNVQAVPTVVILHNGKEQKRLVGLNRSDRYGAILNSLLGGDPLASTPPEVE